MLFFTAKYGQSERYTQSLACFQVSRIRRAGCSLLKTRNTQYTNSIMPCFEFNQDQPDLCTVTDTPARHAKRHLRYKYSTHAHTARAATPLTSTRLTTLLEQRCALTHNTVTSCSQHTALCSHNFAQVRFFILPQPPKNGLQRITARPFPRKQLCLTRPKGHTNRWIGNCLTRTCDVSRFVGARVHKKNNRRQAQSASQIHDHHNMSAVLSCSCFFFSDVLAKNWNCTARVSQTPLEIAPQLATPAVPASFFAKRAGFIWSASEVVRF